MKKFKKALGWMIVALLVFFGVYGLMLVAGSWHMLWEVMKGLLAFVGGSLLIIFLCFLASGLIKGEI